MTDALVLWTARGAALAFAARWLSEPAVLRPANRGVAPPDSLWPFRWWSLGCLLHLTHVAAAYHCVHGWSHAAAWAQTAERTAAVTGVAWGGGLWLNDLFTLLWPLDLLRWRWERRRHRRFVPRGVVAAWNGFALFMVVNATVVFGSRWWLVVAAAVAVALVTRRLGKSGPG